MTELMFIAILFNVCMAPTGSATGIIFIDSVAIVLYTLFTLIFNRKNKEEDDEDETKTIIVYLVLGLLFLAYSACYLFFGIDVNAFLGIYQ